jgi:hypothetical protein
MRTINREGSVRERRKKITKPLSCDNLSPGPISNPRPPNYKAPPRDLWCVSCKTKLSLSGGHEFIFSWLWPQQLSARNPLYRNDPRKLIEFCKVDHPCISPLASSWYRNDLNAAACAYDALISRNLRIFVSTAELLRRIKNKTIGSKRKY